jgi:hypothetical protein
MQDIALLLTYILTELYMHSDDTSRQSYGLGLDGFRTPAKTSAIYTGKIT